MKNYPDLYAESPRAFLRKLEEDIKGIETRLAKLDKVATDSVADLLTEYERLSLLVEQKAYGAEQVQVWRWTPDAGAKVANLYPSERLDDGRAFCWTGPQPVTEFVVPLARDLPLQLCIPFMKTFEPAMLEALKVSIDGVVINHLVNDLQVEAIIAPRMPLTSKPTRIAVSTGATGNPAGDDTRRLGIALFGMVIAPAAGGERA